MFAGRRMAFLLVPAKYLPAKRNKGRLLQDDNSFLYNLSRKSETKSFWICTKKSTNGCTDIKVEDANGDVDQIIDVRGNHNHDSDLMADASKKAFRDEANLASRDLNI